MKATFPKLIVVASLLAAVQAVNANTTNAPASKWVPVRSVFTMPSNFREGRDPFFPESARPFESAVAATRTIEATTLISPGFSISRGKRMAIINNHTFAVGDEGDVLTTSGRVHVRCLEIRNDLVIVEANGQRREISFSSK